MNDDINRMNTVFKFHFQSWILLNLGASLLIPLAFQDTNKKIYKNTFSYLLGILIILGFKPTSNIALSIRYKFKKYDKNVIYFFHMHISS